MGLGDVKNLHTAKEIDLVAERTHNIRQKLCELHICLTRTSIDMDKKIKKQ